LGRQRLLPSENSPAGEIAAWADLFHRFLGYGWPGNVRELSNFVSQVAVASADGPTLPDNVRAALHSSKAAARSVTAEPRRGQRRNMRDVGEEEFHSAMEDCGYEVATVARQLDVSRQSIYRRMDESGRYRLAGQVPLPELEQALARRAGDACAVARDLKVSLSALLARLRNSDLVWH
jgi:two-component system nitrogen regulation response regulator GlnG